MKRLDLSGNPNLDKLLAEARRLGLDVALVKSTGEVRVRGLGTTLTLNARKKEGPGALRNLLRRAQDMEDS